MDALAVPLGALIATIGQSVAAAQQTIDAQVLGHFGAIYDQSVQAFEPLRAIGYQPTWYQVAEATARVTLALTVTQSREVRAAPVDGAYQSRYSYGRTLSSSLTFRIVPVPPPERAGA
jgi:hypothetical protein